MSKKDNLLTPTETFKYLRMSRNTAVKFLDEIGARIEITPKKIFYDREIIDQAIKERTSKFVR